MSTWTPDERQSRARLEAGGGLLQSTMKVLGAEHLDERRLRQVVADAESVIVQLSEQEASLTARLELLESSLAEAVRKGHVESIMPAAAEVSNKIARLERSVSTLKVRLQFKAGARAPAR